MKKFMSEKLRDAKGEGIKLRKNKKICLESLEKRLECDKREFEKVKKEVKSQVKKVKAKLRKKNEDKVDFKVKGKMLEKWGIYVKEISKNEGKSMIE